MDFDGPRPETAAEDRDTATPDALFRAHGPAVFAVCLANTRNHHDAEDIMQAVFLKSIDKLSNLREPTRVRGWLMQMGRAGPRGRGPAGPGRGGGAPPEPPSGGGRRDGGRGGADARAARRGRGGARDAGAVRAARAQDDGGPLSAAAGRGIVGQLGL